MRRTATLITVGLLALAFGSLPGNAAAPQRVQIVEKEWTITLSRQVLRSSTPAQIEVVNFGQDAHDLVILRNAPGAKPLHLPKLDHFGRNEIKVRLKPGRYTLWCSLPGHRQRGMVAPLRVK